MKNIKNFLVNEGRKVSYRVAFLDTKDNEGIPFGVDILVDPQYTRQFEEFLLNEEGNIFVHADGGNVEY